MTCVASAGSEFRAAMLRIAVHVPSEGMRLPAACTRVSQMCLVAAYYVLVRTSTFRQAVRGLTWEALLKVSSKYCQ